MDSQFHRSFFFAFSYENVNGYMVEVLWSSSVKRLCYLIVLFDFIFFRMSKKNGILVEI